jgi:hypothetical protein
MLVIINEPKVGRLVTGSCVCLEIVLRVLRYEVRIPRELSTFTRSKSALTRDWGGFRIDGLLYN